MLRSMKPEHVPDKGFGASVSWLCRHRCDCEGELRRLGRCNRRYEEIAFSAIGRVPPHHSGSLLPHGPRRVELAFARGEKGWG